MNKEDYKDALRKVVSDIDEHIDDIVEYGFKKSTSSIEIIIKVEPGSVLGWDCNYSHTLNYSEVNDENR